MSLPVIELGGPVPGELVGERLVAARYSPPVLPGQSAGLKVWCDGDALNDHAVYGGEDAERIVAVLDRSADVVRAGDHYFVGRKIATVRYRGGGVAVNAGGQLVGLLPGLSPDEVVTFRTAWEAWKRRNAVIPDIVTPGGVVVVGSRLVAACYVPAEDVGPDRFAIGDPRSGVRLWLAGGWEKDQRGRFADVRGEDADAIRDALAPHVGGALVRVGEVLVARDKVDLIRPCGGHGGPDGAVVLAGPFRGETTFPGQGKQFWADWNGTTPAAPTPEETPPVADAAKRETPEPAAPVRRLQGRSPRILTALRALLEASAEMQAEARELGLHKDLPRLAYATDYCTVRLQTGRRAGHSTAAMRYAAERGGDCIYVTGLPVMPPAARMLGEPFKYAAVADAFDPAAVRGIATDLIIVDNASMIRPERLAELVAGTIGCTAYSDTFHYLLIG
jgi:hypothetical protein